MESSTRADPERDLARAGDELEERIDRLDGHIDEARQAARAQASGGEDVAGDWEDTDDASGGEDPATFDDPDQVDPDELDELDEDA
jgi:hypothetical protein